MVREEIQIQHKENIVYRKRIGRWPNTVFKAICRHPQ